MLASTLLVVSCATVVERRTAPGSDVVVQPVEIPRADDSLEARGLLVPVKGVKVAQLRDTFSDKRGRRVHEALDIMAPRGTPVLAADDGVVAKVRRHPLGGLSIHQYDSRREYAYYYAHLDRYAPGLREGREVRRGDVIGFVGSTGNAPESAPHLHFGVTRMDARKVWHRGEAVNPFPYLRD